MEPVSAGILTALALANGVLKLVDALKTRTSALPLRGDILTTYDQALGLLDAAIAASPTEDSLVAVRAALRALKPLLEASLTPANVDGAMSLLSHSSQLLSAFHISEYEKRALKAAEQMEADCNNGKLNIWGRPVQALVAILLCLSVAACCNHYGHESVVTTASGKKMLVYEFPEGVNPESVQATFLESRVQVGAPLPDTTLTGS